LAVILILCIPGCANPKPLPAEKLAVHEDPVSFVSKGFTLAGTLVLPEGSGPHPAVILFHGSGPERRNLFMARWFAAHGFAALAYDKRGVGDSQGDFQAVPFMDLCDDGIAALQYLKSRKDIDPKRIGVWGQSQGGWLAPLAASRSSDVSFVIVVSGPAVSPGGQMLFYYANDLRARGLSEADVADVTALRRDVWNYLSNGSGYEKVKDEMNRARAERWYEEVKAQQDNLFGPLRTPSEVNAPANSRAIWFKHEMNYDPVPALQALRVPALFVFGGQDRLVPTKESIAVIRQTLAQSGNRDFTIQEFPNDDHGMCRPESYAGCDVDPEYLEAMRTWLAAHIQVQR
jgi:uncharacterized protein